MSKRGTQRTRGNLKPTSSTKATATFLTHGISPLAFFSGELSISNGVDENNIDNDIDSDLRVILRKLTKKDSTTKIRAFNELRDYCDANESDDKIRVILPFFVSHYRKWSTDSDQRVRDECQSTFDTIGMRMKKNLSPHLKTILPIWLMAQCDSYAPAASKAKFLYTKLFNGQNKQAEAVYFARNEIMSTLTDEINQCSDVLKDRKENEMETDDAHERRLTQVLLALALFLNYLEANKRSDLTNHFKIIFDSGKFWKLDKIKSIQIQSSFYRCLYELINLIPDVIQEYKAKVIPLAFYSINETEPKLCPLIWDCLILCLDTFDDCWSLVNYQKAFLPKLYAFLRHACHGNVFGVKDCLLPLIEKIPKTVIDDNANYHFIENFFQSMEEGILSIKGRQQMNNVSSLLKAYMDCLLYILESHSTDQLGFLNERLLPLIRRLLTDKDCSIRSAFARQYVHFLSSIQSFRLYSDHLNNVLSLFHKLINPSSSINESNDLKYIFEQSAILFETILSPPKLKNLRFAATTTTTSSSTDLSSIDSTTFQTEDDDELDNNNQKEIYLIQFATDLCQYCFQFCIKYSDHSSFQHGLDLFTRLLNSSTSNNIEIIKKLTDAYDNTNTIPEIFYLNYAKPLMKIAIEQHCSLDHIVELTIQILNTFDSSEGVVERVLADLMQLESSRRFYFLLASIVCRYESSPSFHTWLQEHGVLEELLNMTASVTKSSENNDLNFPVSTEEFQLLSSLLCSSKPTQFLTSIQQEQIVYLACRLLEQQTPTLNESDIHNDLIQSIDHVAKHLFQNIDKTYDNQSTKNLFQLYLHNDINNLIRKNVTLSLHQRSIWLIALKQSNIIQNNIYNQLINIILSYISTQSDNDLFIDMIISICQDEILLSKKFYDILFQRIYLNDNFIYESWIYGIYHGWLLPDQTIDIKIENKKFSEYERLIDVQFICLLIIRQYELNSYIWLNNNDLIKNLILNYYLFQYRCINTKQIFILFERLFHLSTFHIQFNFIDKNLLTNEFYIELIYYHIYCQIKDKYLNINQRDDLIQYTFILNNNDELNTHLILASFFRESQSKLIIPYLIEQCQDERRSELTLAALNQSLIRMNKLGIILDEIYLNNILNILIKSKISSKETLQIIQLWNTLLNHGTFVYKLEHNHWDNVLCLISDLFQNLTNVQQQINQQFTLRTEFLFIHASNLLTTIGNLLTKDNKQEETDLFNKQLLDEWLLLYSKDIYQGLLPLYIALPSALTEFSSFYVTNEMVKSICCAMCTIPIDYLLSNNLKPLFHSEDNQSTLSESIQTIFNHLYHLLCVTPNRSLQYSAYHLLNKLLPHISSTLIRTTNNETIAEDNKTCRLPGSMLEALERSENTIKQLLNENDIVEEHLLDDNGHEIISQSLPTTVVTDKEHIIIGELLNYKLILNLINCYSSVEQRYTYKLMLQEKKLVDRFLSIVLGLIPANPVYNDPSSMQISSITKKLTHSKSMFENDIQLSPNGDLTSTYTIPHLACSVYFQCLSLIPVLVREWYHNQTKRIRDAVDRVTTKYVSPILIQQELDLASTLKDINVGETGLFTVKKHSNTREITAIYNIETSRVEICIRLPMNYPLSTASIDCTHHVGFTKEQWNKWMFQLKTNLIQNNGSIADGLLHWKQNIDKTMQGIEECSICYCILHTNNELPKRTCRTCKKKFHDACLFRWFRSSNKSTCPHCRANF
ncbi:unnamed protein product [Rotaria sordida]|uniref:E3 ubiquitin-protein ligase listerin n=1 Tax=Rotaria sordida TaxID=392033 RepID=A0A813W0K0_9BILA|nr:unnamed protein product [Rotaria sordida]CAF0869590.1 unnamed protein product [Rotaria sordida]CAF3615110.1 unnamed protein product [Rotaria sordida]